MEQEYGDLVCLLPATGGEHCVQPVLSSKVLPTTPAPRDISALGLCASSSGSFPVFVGTSQPFCFLSGSSLVYLMDGHSAQASLLPSSFLGVLSF